jgi:Ca2+-binding RTX toxin-like protein
MFAPATPPDLTVSNLGLSGTTVSYTVNDSAANAGASTTGIYLSTDSTITTGDTLLTTVATPALNAGTSDNENAALVLPSNLTPGTYYVGAVTDYNNQVVEGNETNNASSGAPIILGNDSANTLTGTAGNDTMVAFAGDDTLNGGAGADTMIGGLGNDTYSVDNLGDIITENANEGTDLVNVSVSGSEYEARMTGSPEKWVS